MNADDRWSWQVAGLMLALTMLPLALAAAATPAGHEFSGFVYEARDGVSYVGRATEGLQGALLYHDPYTSEAQSPTLVYIPYLLLGQLDRVVRLPLPVLLHLARLMLGLALLRVTWLLACSSSQRPGARRLAFLLVLLGGGLGALTGGHLNAFGYHYVSLDVSVSGTTGLEALSLAPHILLACLGLGALALCWLRNESQPSWRPVAAAAAWTLAISAVYPQLAVLWAAVSVASWLAWRRRELLPMVGAVVLAALPYAAYSAYLRAANPLFRNWPPQGDVDLGDPLSFLLYGHFLMLPFAVLAVIACWRRRALAGRRLGVAGLCATWVVVLTVVMYFPGLPTAVHRVYYGSFIPYGLLAADGLWRWARERPRPSRRLLVYPAMMMCLAGAWAVGEGVAIPALHRDDLAVYFPRDEAVVLRAISPGSGGRRGIVMSSFLSGLFVPGLAGQDAYLGFPFETLDLPAKAVVSRAVYRASDPAELGRLVRSTRASYLLWGRYEAAFGGEDPGRRAGWREVARSGAARVYAVPAS